MIKQDNSDQNNQQQPVTADLTVNGGQAEAVKGGAAVDYFLRLKGVDGEATDRF